ncbi:NADH-quinone oxidoreductase subunit M [Pelagicoccus sp. SDUM812003]|uniref:complex I subunit 4 family protein n=1 Tax=Pelagicoccus sp. SDUM812003 TaxID=3041267 RepID=UPI002810250C|nr:NADH-quinone oxidoreductase subunit M [Pelagicoccus sp. SDUM812003]MDQ8202654.1 NADH-quinone oxidoreductase subunit M [Pelagicoccus sp. SDUM812003]
MNDSVSLLHFTIAVPIVAAFLTLYMGRFGRPGAQTVAIAGFAIPAILALIAWAIYQPSVPGGYDFVTRHDTGLEVVGISLHLGLNGVSLPLFVMAGIVGLAAGIYAAQSKAENLPRYLFCLLIMQGGLMGVFASIDIFFFYFFHELALIPTFVMIGVWGGRDRGYAAMKMTIYLTLGAMLSLAGLIALYVKSGAGSFDLITLKAHLAEAPLAETVQRYAFGLLLFGFGILVSLWPLHTWAPLGYGAAPSSAAMLHAGVLKKFGLYGLIQVAVPLIPGGVSHWENWIIWLALGNVVIIGLVTMAQRDLKQMLGYSSVMHMGYAFLGIAAMSVLGAGAAVIMMVAHGLTVALLFMLATMVHHRTQTFEMEEMGGLAKKAPVLSAFFVCGMMASIGLPGPGLANFWGEFGIFLSLWQFKSWLVFVAATGIVISAIYGLRAVARVFFGQESDEFLESQKEVAVTDMTWAERVPAIILIIMLFFIGFFPKTVTTPLNQALESEAVYASSEVDE